MKNLKAILFVLSLLVFNITYGQSDTTILTEKELVKTNYQKNLIETNESIVKLIELSKGFKEGKISLETLQKGYLKTRSKFKTVEFLLEYFDHELVKTNINGPVSDNLYLEKRGLQIIDMMLYSTEAKKEKQTIHNTITTFGSDFFELSNKHIILSPTDLNVFEASRDELIRLYTIGLSGYETKGSNNTFADALTVLNTLKASINPYLDYDKYPKLTESIMQSFNGALIAVKKAIYLKSFDKMDFLRSYINPLYKDLYHLQIKSGIKDANESTSINNQRYFETTS